ncbi:MAG: hypothetical protein J7L07_03815 [Candidatus Odinarchaeota archaeon]|nr:hypothetical protein [Candidatus Odinarchaeota archaeon]
MKLQDQCIGLLLIFSNNNTIAKNKIIDNDYGLSLSNSLNKLRDKKQQYFNFK